MGALTTPPSAEAISGADRGTGRETSAKRMAALDVCLPCDQPEIQLEGRALSPGWFFKMPCVWQCLVALCDVCHLKVLQIYDKKDRGPLP